jgi:hypothetical protein
MYDGLFYQAGCILKKEGAVALLVKDAEAAEKAAKKHGFITAEKKEIMQGKERLLAVVFSRGAKE